MTKKYTFPAGEYYVGDPCYAIDNAVWDDLIAVTGCFGYNPDDLSDWNDGLYHYKYRPCWCHGTAYGDGMYRGSDGYHYAVDAGLIGIIPIEAVDMSELTSLIDFTGFRIKTFDKDFEVWYNDGVFHFGNIRIKTN